MPIEVAAQAPNPPAITIKPGDSRFNTPAFEDYEAVYSSANGKNGTFRLIAQKSGDGRKLSLTDMIPTRDNVIVAQRQLDLRTHRQEFGSGPYMAWGTHFVFSQASDKGYNWVRIPIGGGEPIQMTGELQNSGYATEMFSPSIASLMPMQIGSTFSVPEAYPHKDGTVSADLDQYRVLRKERLELPSNIQCECWVLEKKTANGMTEHVWVAREAPFVFRRVRDVGGQREFTSDLLSFRLLGN